MKLLVGVVVVVVVGLSDALDNGLAITPPMGWISWEKFRCNKNCDHDPNNCISESLLTDIALRMSEDGYLDAGYEYIIIDDCWMASTRDFAGRLQPDPRRFPTGMKTLASYIHDLRLKFGLFECLGEKTRHGDPGVYNNLKLDAETLASWDIDYVKITHCDNRLPLNQVYPAFGREFTLTYRPILYSCSWPATQGITYADIAKVCNTWRFQNTIANSWEYLTYIMDEYVKIQDNVASVTGPGRWNDPDMLVIGSPGLNYYQAQVQMAIWSIIAAPLFMSADLRNINPEFKEILLNDRVIAVNQDSLGIQGKRVKKVANIEYWIRPVGPLLMNQYSYAVAIVNRDRYISSGVAFTLQELGIASGTRFNVEDLFGSPRYKLVSSQDFHTYDIRPSSVVMLKCTAALN